ncbi:MAG: hypothetical protein HY763_12140 [Planctomycetes bacterium]|nr:hypothetical protein [Planctomycetota bacterium]
MLPTFEMPPQTDASPEAMATRRAVGFGAAAIAVCLVLSHAWVTEDAYITFRYAENFLAGYGPVYNAGERVPGFTHPLWFAVLVVGGLFCDLYWAAIILGAVLTALLVLVLWRVLHGSPQGSLLLAFALVAWFTCPSMLDYQTSGLENALTHLLILCLVAGLVGEVGDKARTVPTSAFFAGLILTNRLDLLFFCVPVGALLVRRLLSAPRKLQLWLRTAAALTPAGLWYSFALVYYGTPLPNTAYAKVGFRSAGETARQGLAYVLDFVAFDPGHAAIVGLCLIIALVTARAWPASGDGHREAMLALALAPWFHIAYVVLVGGDYVRGRFLTPAIVCAVAVAAYGMSRRLSREPAIALLVAAVGAGLPVQFAVDFGNQDQATKTTPAGILRERLQQQAELAHNHLHMSNRREWALALREYARRFGPIVVTYEAAGIAPYQAGPGVSFLDPYGLTDAYTARCPAAPGSRVGHIHHDVPREYFRARGSLSQLPDWQRRVSAMDESLIADAAEMARSVNWRDPADERRYEEVRLLTAGPLLSSSRLGRIGSYAFGSLFHRNVRLVPDGEKLPAVNGIVTCNYTPSFGNPQSILDPASKPEGARWNDPRYAVQLVDRRSAVTITLSDVTLIRRMVIQADSDDQYRVEFSEDGKTFGNPWTVLPVEHFGLRRRATPADFLRRARALRIQPEGSQGEYSVSFLSLLGEPAQPAAPP